MKKNRCLRRRQPTTRRAECRPGVQVTATAPLPGGLEVNTSVPSAPAPAPLPGGFEVNTSVPSAPAPALNSGVAAPPPALAAEAPAAPPPRAPLPAPAITAAAPRPQSTDRRNRLPGTPLPCQVRPPMHSGGCRMEMRSQRLRSGTDGAVGADTAPAVPCGAAPPSAATAPSAPSSRRARGDVGRSVTP